MPDMRGFSATPGSDCYIFACAFFLPWLRHCLSRMGCGQSGKVSKTVNSNVLLAIMKAHADGIDVLRRGDADPRCIMVAKAQAQAQVA